LSKRQVHNTARSTKVRATSLHEATSGGCVLVCHCHAVTDGHIRDLVADGAVDAFDIAAACGAGSECGGCVPRLTELLAALEQEPVLEGTRSSA
jgi:bacterioferritin-associated ferredoxin